VILLRAIHSGGQTGADQGALSAARALGLETGGWAPNGWRTEAGAAPWLEGFGLRQHPSRAYPPRTEANVCDTDGTLIFGNQASAGSRLTASLTHLHERPLIQVPWASGDTLDTAHDDHLRAWLAEHEIRLLNVAGNRESRASGIADAVVAFLVGALG
jgi:hypothetical protein